MLYLEYQKTIVTGRTVEAIYDVMRAEGGELIPLKISKKVANAQFIIGSIIRLIGEVSRSLPYSDSQVVIANESDDGNYIVFQIYQRHVFEDSLKLFIDISLEGLEERASSE